MLFSGSLFITSLRDNKWSSTRSLFLVTLVTSSLSPLNYFFLILLPYLRSFITLFLSSFPLFSSRRSHLYTTPITGLALHSCVYLISSQISALVSRIASRIAKRSTMSPKAAVAPAGQVLHNRDVTPLTSPDNPGFFLQLSWPSLRSLKYTQNSLLLWTSHPSHLSPFSAWVVLATWKWSSWSKLVT